MNSPDYFLEFQYRGSVEGNIRGRALRERLERWLQELNFEEISRSYQDQSYGAVPTFTWSEQGLSLTFTPIPKGPKTRGQPGARPVGVVMPMEMRMLHTHDDIRAAVEGKATKYGALELPLVVAVNILDDFCGDIDIWNALFGEEQLVAIRQADGQRRDEMGPTGSERRLARARRSTQHPCQRRRDHPSTFALESSNSCGGTYSQPVGCSSFAGGIIAASPADC